MKNIQAIILAAGKSTRFQTGKTKLLEKICGQEMIIYITKLLERANIPTTMVVGYQKELIIEAVKNNHITDIQFVTQEVQKGTGHAILSSRDTWNQQDILICNGDCPLLTENTIEELYETHIASDAAISFIVAHNADPSVKGYGRIVESNGVIKIVEAKDFTGDATTDCCINAGIYLIKKEFLTQYIDSLNTNNNSNEFYLTDLIEIASKNGKKVTTVTASFDQIRGINTLEELWIAQQIKRAEIIKYWMHNGVRFALAQNVHIDLPVTIGQGSYIGGGVQLLGNTQIGQACAIYDFSSIENSMLHNDVTVFSHSVIKDATIEDHTQVGPFAHIHDHAHIEKNTCTGSFSEITNKTHTTNAQQIMKATSVYNTTNNPETPR